MSRQRPISNINTYKTARKRKPEKTDEKRIITKPDVSLIIIIGLLTMLGCVAVFSAGVPQGLATTGNPFYYPIRHLIFVIIGLGMFLFTAKIDYRKWKEWAIPVSMTIIGLILATLIPGLGKTELGSSRWLTFLPIQPSEFGKFACILLGAYGLQNAKGIFDKDVMKYFGLIAIMMLIIIKQPNLSIFLLLAATSLSMLLVSGMKFRIVTTAILAFLPAVVYIISVNPYQFDRIRGWLDPFSDPQGIGYNLIQSWYAISSGGFLGVGLGNSKQKLFYLPFGYTDFIFSVIAEELGFIGCCILIILFLLFIDRGFRIAKYCPDKFGRMMAFGITFIIGAQAFINMCVATGVFPITGVTLPLISYGGSSFMATAMMLGVLVNISRHKVNKVTENVKKPE